MSGATPSPREIRESDQLVAITGGRKNAASPPNNLRSEAPAESSGKRSSTKTIG